ncbi:MAG: N,N-dimethylformamidase beta subunit family domain-containing protein, partial [Sphingomonadales bacterium]
MNQYVRHYDPFDLPITGYADRLSVAGGEAIAFHVSTTDTAFDAELIRPGRKPELDEAVPSDLKGRYPGKLQRIHTGSHGVVAGGVDLPEDAEITLDLMPTLPATGHDQGIITWGPDTGLFLNADGCLCLKWGGKAASLPGPLRRGEWYALRLYLDGAASRVVAQIDPCRAGHPRIEAAIDGAAATLAGTDFRLSGWRNGDHTTGCLNGKIAAPRIFSPSRGVVAAWDFSVGHDTDRAPDTGPHGRHMALHHHPRRAVTGPRWRGRVTDFRFAPDEYDAVAFHREDMTDAGWEKSLTWIVPGDLPSGIYALRITCADGQDHIPFVVLPDPAATRNRVAFLAPTFSYLAYANEQHWWPAPDIREVTGGTLDEVLSPAEKWANAVG